MFSLQVENHRKTRRKIWENPRTTIGKWENPRKTIGKSGTIMGQPIGKYGKLIGFSIQKSVLGLLLRYLEGFGQVDGS